MDYSLPGSCVHGISQARILEWVAIFLSRGSSWPRVQTWVSCIAGRCFTIWDTREARHSSALLLESLETDLQSFFHNDTRHYDKHTYIQTAPVFILFSCSYFLSTLISLTVFILLCYIYVCVYAQWLSCIWLFCDPMDRSMPGSCVHGISQARKLKWVAISFSRELKQF